MDNNINYSTPVEQPKKRGKAILIAVIIMFVIGLALAIFYGIFYALIVNGIVAQNAGTNDLGTGIGLALGLVYSILFGGGACLFFLIGGLAGRPNLKDKECKFYLVSKIFCALCWTLLLVILVSFTIVFIIVTI